MARQEGASAAGYEGVRRNLSELIAPPAGRKALMHSVQEVRRHQQVTIRFGYSLDPSDRERDIKAGVVSVRFISTNETTLPPLDTQFRESERYGYYVYFGTEGGVTHGEFDRVFSVPYHANRFVLTLLPFSNPSVKIVTFSSMIAPIG